MDAIGRVDWESIDDHILASQMRLLARTFLDGIDSDLFLGGLLDTGVHQGIYTESATQNYVLGTKRILPDGREFRYCLSGAAIIAGVMSQGPAPIANYTDEAQTAYGFAIGALTGTVLITTGSTPVADAWKDGWMCCALGTGLGHLYKILSNTSHATLPVVTLETPIRVAIPAASTISIIPCQYRGTITVPTTVTTGVPVGVPLIGITSGYYYWSQVHGPAPLLVDTSETIVIGCPVGLPNTADVAGACGVALVSKPIYGKCMVVEGATYYAIIDLTIE